MLRHYKCCHNEQQTVKNTERVRASDSNICVWYACVLLVLFELIHNFFSVSCRSTSGSRPIGCVFSSLFFFIYFCIERPTERAKTSLLLEEIQSGDPSYIDISLVITAATGPYFCARSRAKLRARAIDYPPILVHHQPLTRRVSNDFGNRAEQSSKIT